MKRDDLIIAGTRIKPGERSRVHLTLSMLHSSTPIDVPVDVIHAKKDGPVLLLTAALHGDELNGVEIIRRLHQSASLKRLRGTLISIPIVNIYGFMLQSRYLPDRRDLNRQFPGSESGSLASRLASLLMREVISKVTHAIDLHTGAIHRSNYPQCRYSTECPQSAVLAKYFHAPIMIPSNIRDGSLRHAADTLQIPMIVYEAGEALRFDEMSIKLGVKGILKVMHHLNMITLPASRLKTEHKVAEARATRWIRASMSGMIIHPRPLGSHVKKDDLLCELVDPLGNDVQPIRAPAEGIIIGKTNIPLVNEGDALFNIAFFDDMDAVKLPDDESLIEDD